MDDSTKIKSLEELSKLNGNINLQSCGDFAQSLINSQEDFSKILEKYNAGTIADITNPELLTSLIDSNKWKNLHLLNHPHFPNSEILKVLSDFEKDGKYILDKIPNEIIYPILRRENPPDSLLNQINENPYEQSRWLASIGAILIRVTPNRNVFENFLRKFEETQWDSKLFSEFNKPINKSFPENMAASLLANPLIKDTNYRQRVINLLWKNLANKKIQSELEWT